MFRKLEILLATLTEGCLHKTQWEWLFLVWGSRRNPWCVPPFSWDIRSPLSLIWWLFVF